MWFININASDPGVTYIGETERHFGVRVEEHVGFKLARPTAVGQHIHGCNDCRNKRSQGRLIYENFEIMKICKSKFDAEVHEAILINQLNPNLNTQLFKSGSSVTLRVFS